jgi:molybdopterin converting factor small subunit
MDIARFHYAVDSAVKDLRATSANDHLSSLISALSTVGGNPGQSQFIDQYKNQLEATRNALATSKLNNPKMELSDFIDEFDLTRFVGNGLFSSIKKAIAENQIAPHAAVQALQELQAKFSKKLADLEAINNAFTALHVPYEGDDEGNAEIEIKIPAYQDTKTLHDLSVEAKEWHRDLSTISEIFDPERTESTIRTLATGSWQFYLASAPLVIFGVSKCLRGVNEVLQELIKTKELLKQLIETNAPEKVVKDYEKHLKDSAGINLTNLASNLVDEYYKGADEGRKAELKNALTQSLKRLSKKLSEGSTVSLRLTKPREPKVANPVDPTEEEKAAINLAQKINEVRDATMIELEKISQLEHDPEIVKSLPTPDIDPAQ